MSPECEELREKLDGILYDEDRMQQFDNTINNNNSIPLLELNSFNNSRMEYKEAALSRHAPGLKSMFKVIGDDLVAVKKLGFIVNRVEFEINLISDLELTGLISTLNYLVSCPSSCFITDLYAY